MADNEKPKLSPLVEGAKQKLIDELLDASDRATNDDGSINHEKLRKEQLDILGKYDEQVGSAAEIFAQLGNDIAATQKFADAGTRTLDELLVSKEPWPFDDISELATKFGPLPKGYCYRYLAPEIYHFVPKQVANKANNIIRLPSALNLVIDNHFQWPSDEFPELSLAAWLHGQPAEVNRLWTLRVLSLFGILKRSEVPVSPASEERISGTTAESFPEVKMDPSLAALIDCFKEEAELQYDGEEEGSDVSALGGASDKQSTFHALWKVGLNGCLALQRLLGDPDIGVRVSAAIYLLGFAPQIALPLLRKIAATWPVDEGRKRARSAALHAQQAIWMYEDDKLAIMHFSR
jgi:hypothetical protein